jgi:Potential DNA-binding domain
VKCDDKAMPYAKLCLKHILNDTQQLLLRPCGSVQADLPPCQEPVLAIFPHTLCPYHSKVPKVNFPPPEVSGYEVGVDFCLICFGHGSPNDEKP